MMALKGVGARARVVLSPALRRAVAARRHQPMQHRQKDRALDREIKTPRRQQVRQDPSDPTLVPQPLDDQRGTDGDGLRRHAVAAGMGVEDEQLLRKPPETLHDGVELSGRLELVEAPQPMEHPLDQAAVDPLVFNEEQIGAIAVRLSADEHAVLCVSSDNTR